jgi:hypothetical protein
MRSRTGSIAAAGATTPGAVIGGLRAMAPRSGVLGRYRSDRFGDTTERTFGVYRIRSGALAFAGSVAAP